MRARMNGHFDRVIDLEERIDRLAAEGMGEIEHRAAVAVDLQIERQFASGTRANGEKWPAKADGSPSYLQATGAMKRSKRVTGIGGVRVTIDRPEGWHQSGTRTADGERKMPARPIVPVGRSLPENWSKPIAAAAREVFAEVRVR